MLAPISTVALTLASALQLQAQELELDAAKDKAAEEAAEDAHEQKLKADRKARLEAPKPAPAGSPRDIARSLVSAEQFSCLDSLWTRESQWQVSATNPSSGAYGIPQALPASKMASAGSDWRTNAATQIRWGLDYIQSRYGSPCEAWAHSEATGWY